MAPILRALVLVVPLAACRGGAQVAATTTTASTTTTSTPTTTTAPPTTTTVPPPPAPTPLDDGDLRPGESGAEVLYLQVRLGELGYWLGEPDANYGRLTEQAVLAFQKANGLPRDGVAGPATLDLLAVAGRPAPRAATDGLEIDLERQVLLVVAGGEVRWTFNTSTGRAGWRTRTGTFAVYREIDGLRRAPLGDLYRPKYFDGGIALHGSGSIPAEPASHGCARVSFAAMDLLWSAGVANLGAEVRVY